MAGRRPTAAAADEARLPMWCGGGGGRGRPTSRRDDDRPQRGGRRTFGRGTSRAGGAPSRQPRGAAGAPVQKHWGPCTRVPVGHDDVPVTVGTAARDQRPRARTAVANIGSGRLPLAELVSPTQLWPVVFASLPSFFFFLMDRRERSRNRETDATRSASAFPCCAYPTPSDDLGSGGGAQSNM